MTTQEFAMLLQWRINELTEQEQQNNENYRYDVPKMIVDDLLVKKELLEKLLSAFKD